MDIWIMCSVWEPDQEDVHAAIDGVLTEKGMLVYSIISPDGGKPGPNMSYTCLVRREPWMASATILVPQLDANNVVVSTCPDTFHFDERKYHYPTFFKFRDDVCELFQIFCESRYSGIPLEQSKFWEAFIRRHVWARDPVVANIVIGEIMKTYHANLVEIEKSFIASMKEHISRIRPSLSLTDYQIVSIGPGQYLCIREGMRYPDQKKTVLCHVYYKRPDPLTVQVEYAIGLSGEENKKLISRQLSVMKYFVPIENIVISDAAGESTCVYAFMPVPEHILPRPHWYKVKKGIVLEDAKGSRLLVDS
jgi:hypothetical protein